MSNYCLFYQLNAIDYSPASFGVTPRCQGPLLPCSTGCRALKYAGPPWALHPESGGLRPARTSATEHLPHQQQRLLLHLAARHSALRALLALLSHGREARKAVKNVKNDGVYLAGKRPRITFALRSKR